MRKCNILLVILIISGLHLYSNNTGYNIKLKIKGLKDTVCYLGNYFGDKQYIRDTARINSKSECTFKGKEDLPKGIYLIVTPDKKKYFEIIVNNEQSFSIETDTSNFAQTVKFKGSEEEYTFLRLYKLHS